ASTMRANTSACGSSPNKCDKNTHLTLLEFVGNYMYIGYDNRDYGSQIWRVDMSSVTSGTAPAETAFQMVNISGLDGSSSNQRIFTHVTVNDAGKDWLIVITRDGSNAMRIYRTGNGFD
ncbi:MAG: hypothetical protein N2Z22_08390, partial [Turneriella sp.]|nr:hypothetical protein [Turneriella sp.]